MAYVKKCDGCGKLSPDDNGIHHANSWYLVTVDHCSRRRPGPESFMLCEKCFGVEEPATPFRPWVVRLVAAVKRAFR